MLDLVCLLRICMTAGYRKLTAGRRAPQTLNRTEAMPPSTASGFHHRHAGKMLLCLLVLMCGACSESGKSKTPGTGGKSQSPSTDPSVVAFSKTLFPVLDAYCVACHTNSGPGKPKFAEGEITVAHDALINGKLVNFDDIPASRIVQRLTADGHSCWSDCASDGNTVAAAISAWAKELAAQTQTPDVKAFAATVYPLVVKSCATCHDGSQAIVGFANPDTQAAYAATVNNQKVDLQSPTNSRLYIRLGDHGCLAQCTITKTEMEQAIITWANLVKPADNGPNSPNTQPIAVSDAVFTNVGIAVKTDNVLTNDVDLDGDTLLVMSFDGNSARGATITFDNSSGKFTYNPPINLSGLDNFKYIIGDGRGGAAIGTVFVSIDANPTLRDNNRFLQFINRSSPLHQETAATASAYYASIDPLGKRANFAGFLATNGFTNNPNGFSSDAVAVYQNDYDLGFGRRMFVRRLANGDVASYVENYANLEAAKLNGFDPTSQTGLIATVAMEFRAVNPNISDTQDPENKATTFYVYNPDGSRALSVDLDGRGSRFVPGLCNGCHGGRPKKVSLDQYTDFGDTGGRFLTWDLNTYIFDADPASSFSRANQETQFRNMNASVMLTNPTDAQRELIYGWYGSNSAPDRARNNRDARIARQLLDESDIRTRTDKKFDGNFVPSGWSNASNLYTRVIAPYCRACHVVRGKNPVQTSIDFRSYNDFMVFKTRTQDLVFDQSVMPMALRTFDKFWNDSPNTANILAQHINSPRLLEDQLTIMRPGRPVAYPGPFRRAPLGRVDLNGKGSFYAAGVNAFSWNLSTPAGSSAVLQGATTANPFFIADVPGDYIAQLIVNDELPETPPSPPAEVVIRVDADLSPISFISNVVPYLSGQNSAVFGQGCALQGCHNSTSQLKLPNFGDPFAIHSNMLDFVDIDDPLHSRIITQPSAETPHGGQVRPFFESRVKPGYDAMLRWIVEGAKNN